MLMMFVNVEEIENFQFQVHAENLFYIITTNTNMFKNLVSRELIEFCWYLFYVENCKCALSWWHKEQNEFPNIAIITQHILGILACQIETKHIFYVGNIWLHFVHFVSKYNMDKLIFVNKN
jgi:hypothetical protein